MSGFGKVTAVLFVISLVAPASLSAQEYPGPYGNGYSVSEPKAITTTPLLRETTRSVDIDFQPASGDLVKKEDGRNCKDPSHKHVHGFDPGSTFYHKYIVNVNKAGTKGIPRRVGKFVPHPTDSSRGWFTDSRGVIHKAEELYEEFEPESDGHKRTSGNRPVHADGYWVEDSDGGHWEGIIGIYHIRGYRGNLLSKGWFGSDEFDSLAFSMKTEAVEAEEWESWKTGAHKGKARLTGAQYSYTRCFVIGGVSDWLEWIPWVDSYRADIQPTLETIVSPTGVGAETPEYDTYRTKYQQNVDPSREEFVKVTGKVRAEGAIGPFSGAVEATPAPDNPGARAYKREVVLEVTDSGEEETAIYLNPVQELLPIYTERKGAASSVADITWRNTLALFIQTNDTLATWEFRMEMDSKLQITERNSSQ